MNSFADLYIMRNFARELLGHDDAPASQIESEAEKAERRAQVDDWEFVIETTNTEMESRVRDYARFHKDAQERFRAGE